MNYATSQPLVGDEVLIAGPVLKIQQYLAESGAEMHRFMISRPSIDGVRARSAYLTACTGPSEACAADGFDMVSTDGVELGSRISAYGVISMINVKRYYSTYYIDATTDI